MPDRTELKQHASLFDRMATTVGVDLQEAAIKGALSVDEVSEAVLACTDCADPGHCLGWLADHDGRTAAATPGYCRNQDLLGRLQSASKGRTT